jgi:hypothetical protein
MISNNLIRAQGRTLSVDELVAIQILIDVHPDWSRHRVAKELCQRWEWRTALGQLKTFAARSLLLTLAQRHQLRLPPVRQECRRFPWGVRPLEADPYRENGYLNIAWNSFDSGRFSLFSRSRMARR